MSRDGAQDGDGVGPLLQAAVQRPFETGQIAAADGEGQVFQAERRAVADAGAGVLQLDRAAALVEDQLLHLAAGELAVAAEHGSQVGERVLRDPQARLLRHLANQPGKVAAVVAVARQGGAGLRRFEGLAQRRAGRQVAALHDDQRVALGILEKFAEQLAEPVGRLAHPHRAPAAGKRHRRRLVG